MSGFYKLTADIDLSGYPNFESIGTADDPFRGYFCGDNYVIKNLEIVRNNENYQGLFGYANGAHISDLTLENPFVNARNGVGALLGVGIGTVIERVAIINPEIYGNNQVGGIVGETLANNASFIRDCYVENGDINTRSTGVGGILGLARDTRIENSYFSGTITAPASTQDNNAGGIIGTTGNERVILKSVASLATAIDGGTAGQFVSRGPRLVEFPNIYCRSNMQLSRNVGDSGFGRASSAQNKPLSDFKQQSLYESTMGWDFDNTWSMQEDGFPVFRAKTTTGIKNQNVVGIKNLKVSQSNEQLTFEVTNPASVWIYETSGKLVNRLDVSSSKSITLPQGIYIIRSISNGVVESTKVFKN